MKLKYVSKGDYGSLISYYADPAVVYEQHCKIWGFIHIHLHHVLRQYYRESVMAVPQYPRDYDDNMHKEGFVLISFNSKLEEHLPYIAILQKELNIEIEDLPQKEQ